MHGRFHRIFAASVALIAVSGCVQATRHSNTMLFGTNTTFGIKAGTATDGVPKVIVGYDRQEAVILPLVANTGEQGGANRLTPCDVGAAVEVAGGGAFPIHPCLLVATNGNATDAYSVLASFGADFGGSAEGGATVKGGLAQYFATGLAAQLLALSGGASVVNAGAQGGTTDPAAITALIGTADQRNHAVLFAGNYTAFKADLRTRIEGEVSDQTMVASLTGFENKITAKWKLSAICSSKIACLAEIDKPGATPFDNIYRTKPTVVKDALDNWGK